jgi:hypothetical protein
VEAFQANPKYLIDISFDVPKLDLTGFRLEFRRLGQIITSMDEDFEDIPEGMRYRVTMTIGSTVPLLGTVTRLVRTHVLAATLDAWHLHNVQEVGNLPYFLPDLYAAHAEERP